MPGKPKAKSAPAVDLNALTGDLAALRMLAGDSMMTEACELLRARLALTPEKLMAILMRRVAPDEHVKKGEESDLRGIDRESLKGYKDARMLPEFYGFNDPRTAPRQ